MKKMIDPGLAYMQRLGIKPARNLTNFSSALAERIGNDAAENLRQLNTQRMATGLSEDNLAFYAYKNSSLEISAAFSGLYEGNVFRRACNWIQKNLIWFGKAVLDVGCDNGIMSCFLASSLPGCRIVSIDHYESAAILARQLADNLGLTNIQFIAKGVDSLSSDLKFDTVFSMRTIHENVDYSGYPTYSLFSKKGDYYGKKLKEYADSLAARIKDKGTLVSIERGDRPELLRGWLHALNGAGMILSSERTEGITASELGEDLLFQAAVCIKADGQEPPKERDIYDIWYALVTKETDFSATEYQGWESELRFEDLAAERLKQITYRDGASEVAGRIGLWTCGDRDGTLLVFNKLDNKSFLYLYGAERLEELIEMLRTHKRDTTSCGFRAHEE